MITETIRLNDERNVTLTCYRLETGGSLKHIEKRPAVLILPGGAYEYCSIREGDPVAFEYLKAGYHAFILHYSVAKDKQWPKPLEDYEQAISLLREKAEEWQIYGDKIAVIGFSAGGHLAAAAATMAKQRPNAAILGYALTSSDVKPFNASAPDTVGEVDSLTPPCFLFHTRTDETVPVRNTIRFTDALEKQGIHFESHIYSYGPHGFSIAQPSVLYPGTKITDRAQRWVSDSVGWLEEIFGCFGDHEMMEPAVKGTFSRDDEEYLSFDTTLERIMTIPEAKKLLEDTVPELRLDQDVLQGIGRMKLRTIVKHSSLSAEQADELEKKIAEIPNQLQEVK